MPKDIKSKSSIVLAEEFSEKTSHSTLQGEQYTSAIQAVSAKEISESADRVQSAIIKLNGEVHKSTTNLIESIEDFRETVKKAGESSDELSSKIHYLNIILVIATVVGAIISVLSFLFQIGVFH